MTESAANGATVFDYLEYCNSDGLFGLKSSWPVAKDLSGSDAPFRFEGEAADLVVFGNLPQDINGTFYRIMSDPFIPPVPGNVPIDGDGEVSAFRFRNGRVDMRVRYVETERLKLERRARKALFGLYRNPFTHHPCVRAAVDSTANTNLVYWAGHLLALKEVALPYSLNPHTLETLTYDPFGPQIKAKTFTAHPKIDPYTNELIVYGYEAKGLGTLDIVVYALDTNGNKKDEQWIKSPWCAFIHDCAITPNYVILFLWPFEANIERMKAGKQHWAWNYERKATFIIVPRRPDVVPAGWKPGEYRWYEWENCMLVHTAAGWEENGKLYAESSRVHDNAFPFFPSEDGRHPAPDTKADFVRWEFDLTKPTGTKVPDPEVLLHHPSEFPRIDERFMTHKYRWVYLDTYIPDQPGGDQGVFMGLNSLAMRDNESGETTYFYPGANSYCQEPVFIPRSKDAPEGDGWVMSMIERRTSNICELVVIDTRNFKVPVAIVRLPFHMKAQVHGNWVEEEIIGEGSLVRGTEEVKISGRGALEPL